MRAWLLFVAWLVGCTTANAQNPPPVPPPANAATAATTPAASGDPPADQQTAVDTAKRDCKTLVQGVESWKLHHYDEAAKCPTTDDLKIDTLKPDQNVNDPWGTPYKIVCSGDDFGATSAGPDRQWNSADDIWAGVKLTSPGTPKPK